MNVNKHSDRFQMSWEFKPSSLAINVTPSIMCWCGLIYIALSSLAYRVPRMQAIGRFRISPISISSVSLLYILLSYIYDWTHHHLDLDCVSAMNFQFGVRKMDPHPAVALPKKIPSPTQKKTLPSRPPRWIVSGINQWLWRKITNPPKKWTFCKIRFWLNADSEILFYSVLGTVLYFIGKFGTRFFWRPREPPPLHLLHLCLAETPRPRDFAASPNNPRAVPGVDVAIVALPFGLPRMVIWLTGQCWLYPAW